MNTTTIIQLARKHIAANAAMESSARLCLCDAIALYDEGKLDQARERAVKSLAYSVGILHKDYLRAMTSKNDLTQHAQNGWNMITSLRPAYDSSPAGMAYMAGLAQRGKGLPMPGTARMGRGYTVNLTVGTAKIVYDMAKLPTFNQLWLLADAVSRRAEVAK